VSVDESLMMWKGHLLWKVHIPSKCARFGIKSFELCEAISGYIWNFIVYTGQDTVFDESLKNEPYGSKVVLQLMAPLLNQGYCVIQDNWFSSPVHSSTLALNLRTQQYETLFVNEASSVTISQIGSLCL
jgi:hypothetical protein